MSKQILQAAADQSARDAEVLCGEACALSGVVVMLEEMRDGERHIAIAAIARCMAGEIDSACATITKLANELGALADMARDGAMALQLRADHAES